MHVTNKQFSDKYDNDWKTIQNGRFIAIFLGARELEKFFMYPYQICYTCYFISSSRTSLLMTENNINGRFIVIFGISRQ